MKNFFTNLQLKFPFPCYYTNNIIFSGVALSIKELNYSRLVVLRDDIFVCFSPYCFWYLFLFVLFYFLFLHSWLEEQLFVHVQGSVARETSRIICLQLFGCKCCISVARRQAEPLWASLCLGCSFGCQSAVLNIGIPATCFG